MITDYYKTQPDLCNSTDELIAPGEIFFYSHADKCLVISDELSGTDIYDKTQFTLLGTVIRTTDKEAVLLSPYIISEELDLQSIHGASTENLERYINSQISKSPIKHVKSRLISSEDIENMSSNYLPIISGLFNMSGMIQNSQVDFSKIILTGNIIMSDKKSKLNILLGGIQANAYSQITEYIPDEANNSYSVMTNDEFFSKCSDKPEIITINPDETPAHAKATIKEKTYGDLTLTMTYDKFLRRFSLINLVDIYAPVVNVVKID